MKRRIAVTVALALLLAGCAKEGPKTATPQDFTATTACSLDGMLLAEFPGPKAQIHYADGKMDWFCDTVELFSIYFKPELATRVAALYVQDMAKASFEAPRGNWIDARSAYFVKGSSKRGSMGPTLISFARQADAEAFAKAFGGQTLAFAEVKPEMVRLDGGALHDHRM